MNKRNITIFLISLAILAAIPAALGLKYDRHMPLDYYTLMGRNILGQGYKLSIETPKPLIAVLALLRPEHVYLITCALTAAMTVCLVELATAMGASTVTGIAAAILCIFGSREMFGYELLTSAWVAIYAPLMFGFVLLFHKRMYKSAAVCILLLGLIRPEAWLYTPAFILILKFIKREELKPIYFIGLLAPLLWMAFDYRIAGDWFASAHITKHYTDVALPTTVPFWAYWLYISYVIAPEFKDIVVYGGFLALIGLFFIFNRQRQSALTRTTTDTGLDKMRKMVRYIAATHKLALVTLLISLVAVTFLFYWASCVTSIFLCYRFFVPAIMVLCLALALGIEGVVRALKIPLTGTALTIVFITLAYFVIPHDLIMIARKEQARETLWQQNTITLTRELNQYLATHEVTNILMPAQASGTAMIRMTPENSRKVIYICDVYSDVKNLYAHMPAVCLYLKNHHAVEGHAVFDSALERGGTETVHWFGCAFRPVYVLENGQGAIYEVEREKIYI